MFLNNTQAGAVPETAVPRYPAGGAGKFLSDSVSVFEINFFSAERHWYLLLLMSAGIPLPMVVRHQGHCPRRPWRHPPIARRDAALRRFIPHRDAGRAERRLPTLYGQPQAVFTMPVSKGAYVLGSLAFSSILGSRRRCCCGSSAGSPPLRYAADGIDKSLSGQTDVGVELAVLAGFAVVTMAMGLWRKPWRET
jgi:hypothetical protein